MGWYIPVDGISLEQGDVLRDCPVMEAIEDPSSEEFILTTLSYCAVLTQTCDIDWGKFKHLLVAPLRSQQELSEKDSGYGSGMMMNSIAAEQQAHLTMVGQSGIPRFEWDFLVLDLSMIYPVSLAVAQTLAEAQAPRPRLRSPMRERMSAAIGRLYSRVALDSDDELPRFDSKSAETQCRKYLSQLSTEQRQAFFDSL